MRAHSRSNRTVNSARSRLSATARSFKFSTCSRSPVSSISRASSRSASRSSSSCRAGIAASIFWKSSSATASCSFDVAATSAARADQLRQLFGRQFDALVVLERIQLARLRLLVLRHGQRRDFARPRAAC